MIYTCECNKTYKTERGYIRHQSKCNIHLSSLESSNSVSDNGEEFEDIKEEDVVEPVSDLLSRLTVKNTLKEEVEESDDECCYSKRDFIMKNVYEKKMEYLKKQLFKSHLPKRRIKAYRRMMKKLNNKTIL